MPIIRPKGGIYCFHNSVSGRRYVGMTIFDAAKAIQGAVASLRLGLHHNFHLQADWDICGETVFETEVLEVCRPGVCVARKQFWINQLKADWEDDGYNIKPASIGSLGHRSKLKICNCLECSHKRLFASGVPTNAAEYRLLYSK